jgi:DNA-binding transcriptional LysR family regulator
MSFGLKEIAPLMPEFLAKYSQVSVDLHLSDAVVDLIGSGFDAALCIAALPDSALRARRLRDVSRYLVAAPAYLKRHGRPVHPHDLKDHACLCYAYLPTPDDGDSSMTPAQRFRCVSPVRCGPTMPMRLRRRCSQVLAWRCSRISWPASR